MGSTTLKETTIPIASIDIPSGVLELYSRKKKSPFFVKKIDLYFLRSPGKPPPPPPSPPLLLDAGTTILAPPGNSTVFVVYFDDFNHIIFGVNHCD